MAALGRTWCSGSAAVLTLSWGLPVHRPAVRAIAVGFASVLTRPAPTLWFSFHAYRLEKTGCFASALTHAAPTLWFSFHAYRLEKTGSRPWLLGVQLLGFKDS